MAHCVTVLRFIGPSKLHGWIIVLAFMRHVGAHRGRGGASMEEVRARAVTALETACREQRGPLVVHLLGDARGVVVPVCMGRQDHPRLSK